MKSVKKLNGSDLLEILILAKDLIYKHKEDINQLNLGNGDNENTPL